MHLQDLDDLQLIGVPVLHFLTGDETHQEKVSGKVSCIYNICI